MPESLPSPAPSVSQNTPTPAKEAGPAVGKPPPDRLDGIPDGVLRAAQEILGRLTTTFSDFTLKDDSPSDYEAAVLGCLVPVGWVEVELALEVEQQGRGMATVPVQYFGPRPDGAILAQRARQAAGMDPRGPAFAAIRKARLTAVGNASRQLPPHRLGQQLENAIQSTDLPLSIRFGKPEFVVPKPAADVALPVTPAVPAVEAQSTGPTVANVGYLSPRRIAELLDMSVGAVRKKLERYRVDNKSGFMEDRERGPRDAQFLYDIAVVAPLFLKPKVGQEAKRPANVQRKNSKEKTAR